MKLLTFKHQGSARCGLLLGGDRVLDLQSAAPRLPGRWNELFAHLDELRQTAARWQDARSAPALLPLDAVELLPPVAEPSKIIAVGLNYRDHAEEQSRPLPSAPMLFSKAPSCLQGATGPILLDADLDRVDAEAELAVVIGRRGRAIAAGQAREHIAGYMCFNDVSDRTAQQADKQFFRGKSIDTGGPCGPWIVTPDELPDLASGLRITARWNGRTMQDSNTSQMIFAADRLLEHASRHMTLLPGDILSTGTPGGVGVFRDPPVFLQPGDLVEVEVEGIGVLANPVQRR